MARLQKLMREFKACNGPYPFKEFEKMISQMGFDLVQSGKTGGSRRRYWNKERDKMLFLDEPHDGEMGLGMVRRLKKELEEDGIL